jgi:hypothetical protein
MQTVETTVSSPGLLESRTAKLADWVELSCERMAKSVEEHSRIWLVSLTAVYFACTVAHSLAKRLWFDELFTLYISRTPGWKERLMLSTVDSCPPLFYGLTRACLRLMGENSLAVRMPEILSFWLMCICLFLFLRRRCAAIYAFLGVMIPLVTVAYSYAFEARPYGILLGMAGLSLFCWQSAVEGRKRTLALIGIGLSIAIAVNSHFYGAQIVIPLLAGETWRILKRKRVDWGILCGIMAGLAPLVFLLPMAHSSVSALFDYVRKLPDFWAKPHAVQAVTYFASMFAPCLLPLIAGLFGTAIIYLLRSGKSGRIPSSLPKLPLHETAAVIGYLFIPAAVLLVTYLKTGHFIIRYALTSVVGCTILLVFLTSVLSAGRAILPALLIAASLVFCIQNAARAHSTEPDSVKEFNISSPEYPRGDRLPIVIPDATLFVQLVQYSSPDVGSRLVHLADVADSVRRQGILPELSLAVDRRIVPGRVEEYTHFLRQNPEFWVYCHGNPLMEWLPSRLKEEGWHVEFEAQNVEQVLFRATRHDK